MPHMVTIEIDPAFKPKPELKDQFELAKKLGPARDGRLEVAASTADEAVKNSGGMYRIMTDAAPEAALPAVSLADKSNEELKIMMLSLGVKTEKQMRRADIIATIEKKLGEIEIVDDEAE